MRMEKVHLIGYKYYSTMDKGAHYYKCDFQVHSPRDRQWTGNQFGVNKDQLAGLTNEQKEQITTDRNQFAKEYLEKVRQRGLNAIAITDHHDVVFAKLIRKVSIEENNRFIEQLQYNNCVTVFPGVELTLSNPVSQCLLIFDSDFSDANLDAVINFLGIAPSDELEKSTVETERISQEIINDLVHLHKKLDELPYCKGKYVVLPNVGNGGKHSILRQGFHEHYRKMPCVGGYVDGNIQNDTGYLNKLNGGDTNYGNKSIGVISTSDNRFEDGRLFGQHATWIKWAVPTAEALRQACLAKESRLSQITPELPQVFISQIDVTNSKFLGSFSIELNQQYNALIGGRGTGKSTILEYLRWGLCDQTDIGTTVEEQTEIEKRRQVLIEKTLVPFNGEVRITFNLNGVTHTIKRNSVTKETVLRISDGEFSPVKEDEIRRILPVQAYSQKQLSSVGVRTDELKRFIQLPIGNHLSDLKLKISDNAKKTKVSYNNFLRQKELQKDIVQLNLEIKSLTIQLDTLRKSLPGMSPEDQKTFDRKKNIDFEQTLISKSRSELSTIRGKVNDLSVSLEQYPEPLPTEQEFDNVTLINSIEGAKTKKFEEIKGLVEQLKNSLNADGLAEVGALIKSWEESKANFDSQYEAVKAKVASNQTQLNEISRIEKRIAELNSSLGERNAALKEIGNPDSEFTTLREEWYSLHQNKIDLLNEQALKFSELSKGLIKADVTKNIDIKSIKGQITTAFQGSRIQENKIQAICDDIGGSDSPLEAWKQFLAELRILAELKVTDDKKIELPETPILSSCDFNEGNRTRIVEVLSPDNWLNIATTEVEFNPDFKYTTNNQLGDVIPFSEASAGQQATALLTVLLNQPGTPLIIDQPEDDIDNKAIDDIIRNIWDAKKKRQLIFTSHNANLVVNGDAELVACCDYRDAGSQTRGVIKEQGAIDSRTVKEEITSVMEGGEKAFRLRKDKYGF